MFYQKNWYLLTGICAIFYSFSAFANPQVTEKKSDTITPTRTDRISTQLDFW